MAQGQRQPVPFHLRWLLPQLCGGSTLAWVLVNVASIAAVSALTGVLALQYGATPTQAIVAGLLMLGLPSVRFAWGAPVLVDMPGLALALGAAVFWLIEPRIAVGLALLAGAVSEKAPIWAAIFALEPILLVGLLTPLLRRALVRPAGIDPRDVLAPTLKQPLATGLEYHRGKWRDPLAMLTPWGVCLIVLAAPTPWLLLALAVGYAQLLVATDTVRLYQQAAPAVCVSAAFLIPEAWAVPALLAHWFNPWGGNGL
jgi:hypothetical protein